MPGQHRRVAILYSHPLLGEGLAHLLGSARDLDVCLVHVDDLDQAEEALASQPDVVIVERGLHLQAVDLLPLASNALLIDVGLDAGPSWAYRREELSPQPEDILRTIRQRSRAGHGRRRPGAAVPAAR